MGIPIVVGILFLLVGWLSYWSVHPEHLPAAVCVYADKDCSLAAGTWALVFVTFAAFVAAVAAAFYTAHTYELETAKSLGHRLCADQEHKKSPDVTLYVSSSRSKPLGNEPLHFNDRDFNHQHHAFLNLGRTPLTDVAVIYKIKFPGQAQAKEYRLELDSVQVDGEIHVVIFIRKTLGAVRISWEKPAFEGDKQTLDFHSGKAFTAAAMKPFETGE